MSEHTEHKQPQPQRSSYGREIECNPDTPFSGICIRGTKGCDVIHPEANASSEPPQRKPTPTIAELEAVLDEKVERHIEINPDGSLRVTRPSSEPQEKWTPEYVANIIRNNEFADAFIADAHNAALAAERVTGSNWKCLYEQKCIELAAEREKFLQMDEAHVTAKKELASRLLQAQAAIERGFDENGERIVADATALREHDAAIRNEIATQEWHKGFAAAVEANEGNKVRLIEETLKPLVEALEALKKDIQRGINHASLLRTINKALAQVKEQK